MKMLRGWVMTEMVGSKTEFDFEVEDDATEEEIEEALQEESHNYVYTGYDEVDG